MTVFFRKRTLTLLLAAAFALPHTPSLGAGAKVTIYQGGVGKFKLTKQIPSTVKGYVPLTGQTAFGLLMLQMEYKGKKSTVTIEPKGGKFNYDVLLSLGKGTYNFTIFGGTGSSSQFTGVATFAVNNKKSISRKDPRLDINDKIVAFTKARIGQKIGRGECWDAAQAALDGLGARWVRTTGYGKKLNYKKDKIRPGDIIQFYKVTIVRKEGNATVTEKIGAPDHTAIVMEVTGKRKYKVAHQNVNGKRFMLLGDLDLSGNVSGQIDFYRPEGWLVAK